MLGEKGVHGFEEFQAVALIGEEVVTVRLLDVAVRLPCLLESGNEGPGLLDHHAAVRISVDDEQRHADPVHLMQG